MKCSMQNARVLRRHGFGVAAAALLLAPIAPALAQGGQEGRQDPTWPRSAEQPGQDQRHQIAPDVWMYGWGTTDDQQMQRDQRARRHTDQRYQDAWYPDSRDPRFQDQRQRMSRRDRMDRRGQQDWRSRSAPRQRTGRTFGFRGELLEMQRVNVFGEQHVMARIERANGRKMIVNLGPASTIERLDLQQGDQIMVQGRRMIPAAGRVMANGKVVHVDRPWQTQTSSYRTGGLSNFSASGKVDLTRTRYVDGEQHLIVHLEGPEGWLKTVDVGPRDRLTQQVREGDRIRAYGYRGHIEGDAMLIASRVYLNEELVFPTGRDQHRGHGRDYDYVYDRDNRYPHERDYDRTYYDDDAAYNPGYEYDYDADDDDIDVEVQNADEFDDDDDDALEYDYDYRDDVDIKVERDRDLSRNWREYDGEVVATRKQKTNGEKHLIAIIRLENGRLIDVDMGEVQEDLDETQLVSGADVTLRGNRGDIEGRPVIIAEYIKVNGGKWIRRDAD